MEFFGGWVQLCAAPHSFKHRSRTIHHQRVAKIYITCEATISRMKGEHPSHVISLIMDSDNKIRSTPFYADSRPLDSSTGQLRSNNLELMHHRLRQKKSIEFFLGGFNARRLTRSSVAPARYTTSVYQKYITCETTNSRTKGEHPRRFAHYEQ